MAQYRVDWTIIVDDLNAAGLSLAAIGRHIGVSKPSVWMYKNGGEPYHKNGDALLKLWRGTTGRDEAPMQIDYAAVRHYLRAV